MSLSPTAQRWAALVAEFERSNSTSAEFAAAHNLKSSTLKWWRSELRRIRSRPAFVEVDTPARIADAARAASAAATRPIRVELPSRRLFVEVPVGADLAWLRAVVEALA